jgi:hypothetical protein
VIDLGDISRFLNNPPAESSEESAGQYDSTPEQSEVAGEEGNELEFPEELPGSDADEMIIIEDMPLEEPETLIEQPGEEGEDELIFEEEYIEDVAPELPDIPDQFTEPLETPE